MHFDTARFKLSIDTSALHIQIKFLFNQIEITKFFSIHLYLTIFILAWIIIFASYGSLSYITYNLYSFVVFKPLNGFENLLTILIIFRIVVLKQKQFVREPKDFIQFILKILRSLIKCGNMHIQTHTLYIKVFLTKNTLCSNMIQFPSSDTCFSSFQLMHNPNR